MWRLVPNLGSPHRRAPLPHSWGCGHKAIIIAHAHYISPAPEADGMGRRVEAGAISVLFLLLVVAVEVWVYSMEVNKRVRALRLHVLSFHQLLVSAGGSMVRVETGHASLPARMQVSVCRYCSQSGAHCGVGLRAVFCRTGSAVRGSRARARHQNQQHLHRNLSFLVHLLVSHRPRVLLHWKDLIHLSKKTRDEIGKI